MTPSLGLYGFGLLIGGVTLTVVLALLLLGSDRG